MSDATETTVLDTQTISAPAVDDPAVQNALGDNSQSVDGPAKAKTPEEIAAEEAAKSEELKKAKENHDTRRMEKFYKRAIIAETKAQMLEAQLAQKPVTQEQPPQRSQFQNDASYLQAAVQFEVKKQIPILQQHVQQPVNEANLDEVKKIYPDYDDVMLDADSVQIPDEAYKAAAQSPYRQHVAYYFAKNPEKAAALYKMSPARASAEIGKIEASIEAKIAASKTPASVPVSKAKPPISPVKTQGSTGKIDENRLSDAEWFKLDMQRRIEKSRKRLT